MNSLWYFADTPGPLVTPAPQAPTSVVPNRGVLAPVHLPGADVLFSHWTASEWVGYGALAALIVVLTAVALTTLSWMLHVWRSSSLLTSTGASTHPRPSRHSFTLLVPVRQEGAALTATLDQLVLQDHPSFDIVVIVGDDDPFTEATARGVAARHPELVSVHIDRSAVKSRPGALNSALPDVQGDVVGVFNAGDDVHPGLLSLIDSRFTESDADIVQGAVQFSNFGSSWWGLRSTVDNYFLTRSSLHRHAKSRSVLLGDTVVFIKRGWLEWSAGWDSKALAEGYELGLRLSCAGAHVALAYSNEVVSREQIPAGIASLFAERTRLGVGSIQVLGKAEWHKLPRLRQRIFARYQLTAPFFQSAAAVLTPLVILAALIFQMPTIVGLMTLIPLAVALLTLTVEVAGLSEFGSLVGRKVRVLDYLRLILGAFPYRVVLAVASLNAIITTLEKDHSLEQVSLFGSAHDARTADREPVRSVR